MRHTFYIDGIRVELTHHALLRYAERVRSLYDATPAELRRCCDEIERLFALDKRISDEAPDWCGEVFTEEAAAHRATHYLNIGDDISFPVREQQNEATDKVMVYLVTCLTRGSISHVARVKRNNYNQQRRRRARERRAMQSWVGENNRWN